MRTFGLALIALVPATSAFAQEAPPEERPRTRTRIALGPQLQPAFPGADRMVVRPFVDIARARANEPLAFEAADESLGFPVLWAGGFEFGPAIGFEGARKTRDSKGLPSVGFSVEPGGFVQYGFNAVRFRLELRHGVTGHKSLIGVASADYIARDEDKWLFAIGPRVSFSGAKYQRAYFGVPAASSAASGLPAFDPDGGIHAVGVNAGYLRQLSPRWGVYGFVRYDRLVGDAARSPFVRRDGSRNQLNGGIALSYTFGTLRE